MMGKAAGQTSTQCNIRVPVEFASVFNAWVRESGATNAAILMASFYSFVSRSPEDRAIIMRDCMRWVHAGCPGSIDTASESGFADEVARLTDELDRLERSNRKRRA